MGLIYVKNAKTIDKFTEMVLELGEKEVTLGEIMQEVDFLSEAWFEEFVNAVYDIGDTASDMAKAINELNKQLE